MKLYHELADWWPLLSAPEDYAEESALYWEIITRYKKNIRTALELGSGGGNNAFHLKQHCRMTLSDLSPDMIRVSRQLNPDCQHHVSDMRELNLRQRFDLVFIHDAIMYMTTEEDLRKVFSVADRQLKADGVLFIAPDFFKETFSPSTSHGGHDGPGRSIRYLEWTYDQDPDDNLVEIEYVYLLKYPDGTVHCEHDHGADGIFSKATWIKLLEETGFTVTFEKIDHSELEPDSYYGIVALKG